MALPVIVVKTLLLGANDKKTRNIFAIIIAAIFVPFIAIILIILSLFGNLESANNSLFDYSFTYMEIPADFNDEQRTAIENMREQLAELDILIAEKEENGLDGNMVRAVFTLCNLVRKFWKMKIFLITSGSAIVLRDLFSSSLTLLLKIFRIIFRSMRLPKITRQ